MRARRQMQAASKLVTTHQNVIVTCRGQGATTESATGDSVASAVGSGSRLAG